MEHSKITYENRQSEKRWRTVNKWTVKGPLIVLALILGFLSGPLHWGRSPLVVGVAMIIPILGYRECWDEWKFWTTVAVLGVFQVPLALTVRALMEQQGLPFMLTFGIVDSLLVAAVLSFVCTTQENRGP
jgi:hypothetical protein